MKETEHPTPEDRTLSRAMNALNPGPAQLARMESSVLTALERSRRSLAAEWIELLRVRPLVHAGYSLAAAAGLLLVTPLGAVLLSLLRAQ
ncbi:MAG: hypothetical protein JXR96_30340 [Deltaproteobacteria bacterium]|nr:hypothetical protein [Deltaproteobacteria bacterium]